MNLLNYGPAKTHPHFGRKHCRPSLGVLAHSVGYTVTIVERSPSLRKGGYAVDVRGAAIDVAERMGIPEQLRAADTATQGLYLIDEAGTYLAQMNNAATGNKRGMDLEIMREDISEILNTAIKDTITYIWDDSITSLSETDDGVKVTFEHAAAQTFDMVIGADGQHSNVRRLVFGDGAQFTRSLGRYISIYTASNFLGLNYRQPILNVPGKTIGAYSARNNTKAKALFVFATDESLSYDHHDTTAQKQILKAKFVGCTA